MRKPSVLSVLGLLLAIAACATVAQAQQPARVGTVATVVGSATVARGTAPQPLALKLRDDVFLHDRIATGERSFLRVLLGGKATVTARERSVLTITEAPALSTIGLTIGGIAVAVSKDRMKPGDAVEIRLPNALAVIRGTVVIAEVSQTRAGVHSAVTILRGVVEVTRLDPAGRPVGAPVRVNPLERIRVEASGSLPAPERITAEAAAGLYGQFTVIPRDAPRAGREAAASVAADLARVDALQLGGAAVSVGGTPGAPSPTVGTGSISVPGAAAALPVDVPSITDPLPSSAPLPNLLPSTPPLPSPPPLSAPLPNLLPSTPPLPSPPPLSAPLPNLLPSTPPLPSPPPLSVPLPNLLPSTPPLPSSPPLSAPLPNLLPSTPVLPSPALPKLSPPKLP
jgi:FecR-like protein